MEIESVSLLYKRRPVTPEPQDVPHASPHTVSVTFNDPSLLFCLSRPHSLGPKSFHEVVFYDDI